MRLLTKQHLFFFGGLLFCVCFCYYTCECVLRQNKQMQGGFLIILITEASIASKDRAVVRDIYLASAYPICHIPSTSKRIVCTLLNVWLWVSVLRGIERDYLLKRGYGLLQAHIPLGYLLHCSTLQFHIPCCPKC